MTFLLDTNVCIALMRGTMANVAAHFQSHPVGVLAVCSIVVGELCVGAARSMTPAAEFAKVNTFLAPFPSLPFDDPEARRYADVRADLEVRGLIITDLDMMIAAIALVHGLTLVTNNTKDFARIPALSLDDWEKP